MSDDRTRGSIEDASPRPRRDRRPRERKRRFDVRHSGQRTPHLIRRPPRASQDVRDLFPGETPVKALLDETDQFRAERHFSFLLARATDTSPRGRGTTMRRYQPLNDASAMPTGPCAHKCLYRRLLGRSESTFTHCLSPAGQDRQCHQMHIQCTSGPHQRRLNGHGTLATIMSV